MKGPIKSLSQLPRSVGPVKIRALPVDDIGLGKDYYKRLSEVQAALALSGDEPGCGCPLCEMGYPTSSGVNPPIKTSTDVKKDEKK